MYIDGWKTERLQINKEYFQDYRLEQIYNKTFDRGGSL